jgi:hypothetical protein
MWLTAYTQVATTGLLAIEKCTLNLTIDALYADNMHTVPDSVHTAQSNMSSEL